MNFICYTWFFRNTISQKKKWQFVIFFYGSPTLYCTVEHQPQPLVKYLCRLIIKMDTILYLYLSSVPLRDEFSAHSIPSCTWVSFLVFLPNKRMGMTIVQNLGPKLPYILFAPNILEFYCCHKIRAGIVY